MLGPSWDRRPELTIYAYLREGIVKTGKGRYSVSVCVSDVCVCVCVCLQCVSSVALPWPSLLVRPSPHEFYCVSFSKPGTPSRLFGVHFDGAFYFLPRPEPVSPVLSCLPPALSHTPAYLDPANSTSIGLLRIFRCRPLLRLRLPSARRQVARTQSAAGRDNPSFHRARPAVDQAPRTVCTWRCSRSSCEPTA